MTAPKVPPENQTFWQQMSDLELKVYMHIEMKLLDEAQKVADELKELIEKSIYKKNIRLYYYFMGRIELEKENFQEAIEYFKEAFSLFAHGPLVQNAADIEPLALAYYKTGNIDEAREHYEWITSLTWGRSGSGDIYAKSFYMLGKIYQEQGKKNKAIENYEKFLDLWKDADPGLTEVEDAKKQLAELQELPR